MAAKAVTNPTAKQHRAKRISGYILTLPPTFYTYWIKCSVNITISRPYNLSTTTTT